MPKTDQTQPKGDGLVKFREHPVRYRIVPKDREGNTIPDLRFFDPFDFQESEIWLGQRKSCKSRWKASGRT